MADRTIRTLRQLSTYTRSYQSRLPSRSHNRRAVNLTEYFTSSPNELEMDDDDDDFVESIPLPGSESEAARLNAIHTELHTANAWPAPPTRRITASPSPVSDEWLPPPAPAPLRSPPTASRHWTAGPASSPSTTFPSNLSRQATIRRAARSRIVDFSEFTHRRRTTTRDALTSHPESAETVTEPREGLSPQTVRRFFPFPRSRRYPTSANPAWSEFSDTVSPDSDEPVHYFSIEPAFPAWYDYDHAEPRVSPEAENREETENLLRAPRLRRGGVLPPENMLSRHASPITINTPPIENVVPPPPVLQPETLTSSTPMPEEPVAYPTPGSSENDNLA